MERDRAGELGLADAEGLEGPHPAASCSPSRSAFLGQGYCVCVCMCLCTYLQVCIVYICAGMCGCV